MSDKNRALLVAVLNGIVALGCVGKFFWDLFQGKPGFFQLLCAILWPVLFAMNLRDYLAQNGGPEQ